MSRRTIARWELTGVLVAQSPVHVGGPDDPYPRLSLLRDGLDRPVLPGTALAGVIQAALRTPPDQPKSPDEKAETRLWRPSSPALSGRGEMHEASRVRVDDAPASADAPVETRDHVAIDRFSGAAARGHLYHQEVLPAGTRFPFRMVVEDRGDPAVRRLVERVAALLRGPGVSVGAAVTRGLGRVRLHEARLLRWDLATRDGLLATLRGDATVIELPPPVHHDPPKDVLRIVIPWRPRGPLGVHVSAEGDVVDAFPLTTSDGDGFRLELPGSTIKGVLRSHAERIARTVAGTSALGEFLDQMRADGLGPVADLFGTANDGPAADGATRRGALTAATCLSEVSLPREQWQAVRLPKADGTAGHADPRSDLARLQKAVTELNSAVKGMRFVVAHHVAVDRWTGGAADNRLFAVLEAHADAGAWRPMILDLDLRWLPDERRSAALALLLLVLRDLCDGWIGFGHATTRGMGGVVVDPADVRFHLGAGQALPYPLDRRSLAEVLDDPRITQPLTEAWTTAMTGGRA